MVFLIRIILRITHLFFFCNQITHKLPGTFFVLRIGIQVQLSTGRIIPVSAASGIADDKNNYFVDENGTVYGKKPIDEAQIEQFYYVIQNAKPGNTNIVPLLDVVWEELEP
jgi:hypothetical protein